MYDASRLIEIRNFSYSIGDRPILRDISLTIGRGEFVCLIGPNGAGKTTLIKCLTRIWRGRSGGIFVAGQPLERYRQSQLARHLAYVPQADGRSAPFTVYEFVMLGRYPYLNPFSSVKPEDHRAVGHALEVTGTSAFADRAFDSLSGGECQKVFLAAALAQQAEVLLLDEPTTFLDPRHQVEINRMLVKVNRDENVTVLYATHDVNSAMGGAHRIIALREGEIVFDGAPKELACHEMLRRLYDHDFTITQHPQTGRPVILPNEVENDVQHVVSNSFRIGSAPVQY